MANQSAKKLSQQNSAQLKVLLGGNTISSILFLLFNALEWTVIVSFLLIWLSLYFLYTSVHLRGNDNLKYSKSDLSSTVSQYIIDVVYISWVVQIGSCISNFFWIFYWIIPVFAVYKVISMALPFLKK